MTQKKMSIRAFHKTGILHEINRLVCHPCGIALALEMPDETEPDTEAIRAAIYDAREDPEGFSFEETKREKAEAVAAQVALFRQERERLFGSFVQPCEKGSIPILDTFLATSAEAFDRMAALEAENMLLKATLKAIQEKQCDPGYSLSSIKAMKEMAAVALSGVERSKGTA